MTRLLLPVLACALLPTAMAQTVPPAEIGLSATRLNEITRMLQQACEEKRIAGAVAAVSRHGRVGYLQAVGQRDLQSAVPMTNDTLFRIASMTKAITSAAVMSLVEDGAISLDAPISVYLPEFGDQHTDEPSIHDLLTHRSGLTYGWFGPAELDALYTNNGINHLFEPTEESLSQRVARIARLPLKFRPGTAWDYSVSTDVLGRVVEVVSGLTLEQFFRERFFRPLKMQDTFFYVPPAKQQRLASLYTLDDDGGLQPVGARPIQKSFFRFSASYCTVPGNFCSGGGGLVSSTGDYLRFLHMLLRGGELDGVRVLQRATVAAMTRNQIGDMQIFLPGHGDGFGLGFGVVTDRGGDTDELSVGTYSWGGIFNTYFWVDPQEQLVGVLMTQLFPNDQLTLRDEFRQLAYASMDDAGFERRYAYQPGAEHANPHFNKRQLRVNGAEVSTHPTFASRSEPRSSGLARIRVDEDLRNVRRVDLDLSVWGGHPGTLHKRVSINGRSMHLFPEVGTAAHHCTHQSPTFNLRPMDLVNGHNSLQFACDTGDTFWAHYIVDDATLRVGLRGDDSRLPTAGLDGFSAAVRVHRLPDEAGFTLSLDVPERFRSRIAGVDYEARYLGYDERGNGFRNGWHHCRHHATTPATDQLTDQSADQLADGGRRHELVFPTRMLPAQQRIRFRACVRLANTEELYYRTPTTTVYSVPEREDEAVRLFPASDLPQPFWSRDDRVEECRIHLNVDPADIREAELHVVAWTGGAGRVADYFTLNGTHFPVAEGDTHETVYSISNVDPQLLRRGENIIALHSDTHHHGIEILLPGPALMVRQQVRPTAAQTSKTGTASTTDTESTNTESTETVEHGAVDNGAVQLASATCRTLDCYCITTPTATYYLDKVGAGLASMIDRDGHDWLSFDPQAGTGAAGEYRGFPNAVFQEAGSYFHARNAGTDPSVTNVVENTGERVVISAESDNGLWAGHYTFTATECTFTMTRKPPGHNYWVLYEGTPGGQYNDSDWWMTADSSGRQPLTTPHNGDLAPTQNGELSPVETGGPSPEAPRGEWIAFGDDESSQMLLLQHLNDDPHPDRYYQMEQQMTVFGFGRAGMKKFLSTVPQSFSIGFVDVPETTDCVVRTAVAAGPPANRTANPPANRRSQLAQLALSKQGDADAGKRLFQDPRTKCGTCHRVDQDGGKVGPDLSNIGGKFDRPHLIDSLLYPSRQIGYGYETTTLVTISGKSVSGIAKESTDTHVTLLDAQGKQIRVAKANIEETLISRTSIMPTGLADALSDQEFVDLVSYLETLGRGKSRFGSGVSGPVLLADGFQLETVATGLSGAVAMDIAPDGRVFVCEQGGTLRVIDERQTTSADGGPTPPLTEALSIPVELNWERGLIGVTLAPDFPQDPHIYVVYVTDQPYPHHRISRFRMEGNTADPASEMILLKGDDQRQFGGNVPAGHQGGGIHFGPDGKLYVGLGEQTAGAPAQRMDALQGKILRLNPDGSIPADNPFLTETTGKYGAIWAKGCRNPFTFAFSETGQMLINDVGGKFEEINRGIAGANYGWPNVNHGPTDQEGITGPIHMYPQSCINGGDFCAAGSHWPQEHRGQYFFADFNQGWVKYLDPQAPEKSHRFLAGIRRPVDMRFAPDGSLYILLRNAWVVDDRFEGGTGALVKVSPTRSSRETAD